MTYEILNNSFKMYVWSHNTVSMSQHSGAKTKGTPLRKGLLYSRKIRWALNLTISAQIPS